MALISQSMLNQWVTTGHKAVAQLFHDRQQEVLVAKGQLDHTKADCFGFKTLVHELCLSVLTNEDEKWPTDVATFLKSNLDESNLYAKSMVVDVLWLIWLQLEEEKMPAEKARFVAFVEECSARSIFDQSMLKERLPIEFLAELKLIQSEEVWRKKEVRFRTQTLYRQQKFNLLREEPEGFAKLITELNYYFAPSSGINDQTESILQMVNRLESLVGYFDLDPNRVIDIILESVIVRPDTEERLIRLLGLFNKVTVCHVLGFKLRNVGKRDARTLYDVAAFLLAQGFIVVTDLYAHLSPSDEMIANARANFVNAAIQKAKRANVVSLTEDKPEAAPDEVKAEFTVNQKYELIRALLQRGAWEQAHPLLIHLRQCIPASDAGLGLALCSHVHTVIEEFYAPVAQRARLLGKNKGKTATMTDADYQRFPTAMMVYLRFLGPYLSRDVSLFAKICRCLAHLLRLQLRANVPSGAIQNSNSNDATREGEMGDIDDDTVPTVSSEPVLTEIPEDVEFLIADILLPAFTLIPSNVGISNELWAVLRFTSYPIRYQFYGYWSTGLYTKYPELLEQKLDTISKTKYFRKRVVGSKVKECGRMLVKSALSNPILCFSLILEQIQSFDNFIVPVVESLKYMTALAFDCLSFALLAQLSDTTTSKLKDDGVNESHWFQSLASFTGSLHRKYPEVDLSALLQSICNQLKDERSLDLLVLRELLAQMGSVEAVEEASDGQMEGLAGGRTLQHESSQFKQAKYKKRAITCLLDALLRNNLVAPFIILMAQQKAKIVFCTESTHVKLIGELYDKTQSVLLAFSEFVSTYVSDAEKLASLLPSLYLLITKYHLSPADAFFVLRRVLHLPQIAALPADVPRVEKKEEDTGYNAETLGTPFLLPSVQLIETVTRVLPEDAWAAISPEFYATFWQLQMSDLSVPKSQYAIQIKKVKAAAEAAAKETDEKKKKEKDRLLRTLAKLEEEQKVQKETHAQVLEQCRKRKDIWFGTVEKRNMTVTKFLQYCILPRCLTSAIDAIYCATFVETVVMLEVPFFSIIHFYDQICKILGSLLNSFTAFEATRFGRFFCAALLPMNEWKKSKEHYEKTCMTKPGFATDFFKPWGERLSYDKFSMIVHRWHRLIVRTFSGALTGNNRQQMTNALLILNKIGTVFPRTSTNGDHLEKTIMKITVDPKYEKSAIKVLALRVHALLMAEKKNWVAEPKTAKASSSAPGMNAPSGKADSKPAADKDSGSKPVELKKSSSSDKSEKPDSPRSTKDKTEKKEKEPKKEKDSKEREGSSKREPSREGPVKRTASKEREGPSSKRGPSKEKEREHREPTRERESRRERESDKDGGKGEKEKGEGRSKSRSRTPSREDKTENAPPNKRSKK